MNIKQLSRINRDDFLSGINDITDKTKECLSCLLSTSKYANDSRKLLLANAGFAVDLAVGKLTRNHDDLDLIVLEPELKNFRQYFKNLNFTIDCLDSNDPNFSFTFEKGLIHGDMDTIRIENESVSDKGGKSDDRWTWPIKASVLIWSRIIDDVLIKFVSPTLVYDFKKRQQKRDVKRKKENQDFEILEKCFPYLKQHKIK